MPSQLRSLVAIGAVFFSALPGDPGTNASDPAGDIAVIVPSTAGNYLLGVDAAGNVTLSPLAKVVRVVNPNPTPNPPTPGPLTDRAIAIRDAAAKVTGDADRATTAKGLAELLRQVAILIRQGKVSDVSSLESALTYALDSYLNPPSHPAGVAEAWLPVRKAMGMQITALDFNKAPLAAYATFLDEAASGFDASAPGIAINPDLLKLIMQIIQLVLQLLQPHPTP